MCMHIYIYIYVYRGAQARHHRLPGRPAAGGPRKGTNGVSTDVNYYWYAIIISIIITIAIVIVIVIIVTAAGGSQGGHGRREQAGRARGRDLCWVPDQNHNDNNDNVNDDNM